MNTKKGNAKETQTENFSLDEKLKSMDNNELYDLVQALVRASSDAHRLTLEWLKGRAKNLKEIGKEEEVVPLNDELLMEYWENAEEIISEFNEYGGGPDEDEDEANDWLNKISELIKEGSISTDAKIEFMDAAFMEYNCGNSGFEDSLMDLFFEICETEDEWKYLVQKLEEHPSDWRKDLIMRIQKNYLHDDEAYLKERMKKLHYGMDYWNLVRFYIEKKDSQKAIETAEQGILKGDGRCTELFNYLFNHFSGKNDAANLERIVNTALERKTERKEMIDLLFEYYKAQDDYGNAKKALLKSYEFVGWGSHYAEYKRMKEFLRDSEWKQIEPEIFKKAHEKNLHDYLRICLDKNMKKEVLDTILNPPKNQWGFKITKDFDEFADKLKEDFPEKIIEYYWQKAYGNIPRGDRKTYYAAARYPSKVRYIYTGILKDESAWNKRFSDLKAEFKKRPAFLNEVKNL